MDIKDLVYNGENSSEIQYFENVTPELETSDGDLSFGSDPVSWDLQICDKTPNCKGFEYFEASRRPGRRHAYKKGDC